MNLPAIGPGLLPCSLRLLRVLSEKLVVACTKMIWEDARVRASLLA